MGLATPPLSTFRPDIFLSSGHVSYPMNLITSLLLTVIHSVWIRVQNVKTNVLFPQLALLVIAVLDNNSEPATVRLSVF